jgi:hypothetical protein
MTFFEGKIFHDKRRNLSVYELLPIDFICAEFWWHLLKGSSYTIREGYLQFINRYQKILFAPNHGGIYWMGALPRSEKWFNRLNKSSRLFYLHEVVMAFIEWKLFHDKRTNLIVYKMLTVDFIGTDSYWYLFKRNSFTMTKRTWSFTKCSWSI